MSTLEVNTIDTVSGNANLTIGGSNNTGSTTIKTNNTNAVTIDNSQNVGIGETSPSGKLHVKTADTGGGVNGNGDELILENNGNAGLTILTGSSNTGSIFFADADDANVGGILYDHATDSAAMTFRVGDAVRAIIDTTGKVSVGDSVPFDGGNMNGVQLHSGPPIQCSRDNTASRAQIEFKNPNGSVGTITTSSSSTAYNTSSDHRLKENVVDITGATERLKQLQPKRFNFIADADTTVDGFLAHEVSSIVPEAITGTHNEVQVWEEDEELPEGVSVGDNKLDDEGNTIPVYQGIDQSKLVPLLTASLQEAIAKIETLETEMTALKARVTTLENA